MSENIITEVVTNVVKEQSKEIYEDGLKGATLETGQALQTVIGFVNHVIFYPLKKANLSFKYKLEEFEQELTNKVNKIPANNLIEPPLSIVGPTVEALKYACDSPSLRELYLNLLTSSMNIDKIHFSHPSYVEIIKQFSPLDAKILRKIVDIGKSIKCARITIDFGTNYFTYGMPSIFAPDLLIDGYDPFTISSSIENLCRLGLIKHFDVGTISGEYEYMKEHPYVLSRYSLLKNSNPDKELELRLEKNTILITNFGDNFAEACMAK